MERGKNREQRDKIYLHQLFTLNAALVEYEYIPFTNLARRPLYKFLMIEKKKKRADIESLKASVIQFKPF